MKKSILNRIGLFRHNIYIVVIVVLACITLLLMNYYTVRILSGARAYISGESEYSKGQKDAVINLLLFIDTEEDKYWQQFNQNLQVPLGDREARLALIKDDPKGAIKGLIEGRNHKEDIVLIIWLFSTFEEFEFMKEPISYWEKGDALIMQQYEVGQNIYYKVHNEVLTKEDKLKLKNEVFTLNAELTELESGFLASLGRTSRKIGHFILLINTILILTILIGKSLFSMRTIKNLVASEHHLLQQNKRLKSTNDELDKFVYSASHDLRAPITSLKGLINIMKSDTTSTKDNEYLQLMENTLNKQDVFIRKIIDFSKNKHANVQINKIDLNQLIDEIISQFQFSENFTDISIKKSIFDEPIKTDGVRLEIILSNLISNAIKFTDRLKKEKWIAIKAKLNGNLLIMTIEDNGVGIKANSHDKIFDQFYRSVSKSDGSGVGLYIVKETLNKLNGSIKVDSKIGIGTTFILTIPIQK